MCPIFISVILNDYYIQIVAVFDETDAEQKQKQTCCKPTWVVTHYNFLTWLGAANLLYSLILSQN